MTLGKENLSEGLNVCMNYELNLLHHVGVVAKKLCAVAATHEGDNNTPSGPTVPGVKSGNSHDQQDKGFYLYSFHHWCPGNQSDHHSVDFLCSTDIH